MRIFVFPPPPKRPLIEVTFHWKLTLLVWALLQSPIHNAVAHFMYDLTGDPFWFIYR